jgi:RecA-family ATPase
MIDPEFASAAEWARLYRTKAIQVVPACSHVEVKPGAAWKRPLFKSWTEFQEALVPDDMFDGWYGPHGQYVARLQMGTICGRASNNLFVIDLDTHKNPAAAAWWQGLLAVHNNDMPLETPEQRTGGGGLQKLFRAPPGWTPPTCKTPIGVDIRGQGGFAMLAPSMHESGRAYEWLEGLSPDEVEIALAPDWLLEAIDVLVVAHGGQVSHPSNGTEKINTGKSGMPGHAPNAQSYDGFGHQTDGREEFMRDLVWAAVVDWRRENPIKPSQAESIAKAEEKYAVYEREVSPRVSGADMTKTELLDSEGRGPRAFHVKWQAAMRHWDDKVAEEARQPGKRDAFRTASQLEQNEVEVDPATGQPVPLILTSAEFLAGYSPPAYLIDGMIQRGYLYSLTARTGHGKPAVALYMAQAIARGVPMHGCKVLPGTVLILAGENPDDVRARFFVLGKAYGFDPAASKIRWIPGVKHLPTCMPIIRQEVSEIDDLVLVLVDTAAAYFPGTETNSNSEQGEYARLLRQMTFLKNKPAVIALSHPVKNASRDNLLPMGGSAFLNEVDGNLTLWAGVERQTTLHWQGKFRGPEFDPVTFELVEEHCEAVKNEAGVLLPSVVAKPMAETEVEAAENMAEAEEDRLMRAMHGARMASFATLADQLGWKRRKVQRLMERLAEIKLVEQQRNKKYILTNKGTEMIGGLKQLGHHHD